MGNPRRTNRWIQQARNPRKAGSLHRQLRVPQGETLPISFLRRIVATEIGGTVNNPTMTGKRSVRVTRLLKQRANFALNVRG